MQTRPCPQKRSLPPGRRRPEARGPVSVAGPGAPASARALAAAVALVAAGCGPPSASTRPSEALPYPDTPRSDHVDEYHGTAVPDPYRWLEDLGSEETIHWTRAQDSVARAYEEGALARHPEIAARLSELRAHPGIGDFTRRGDHYFYVETGPERPQPVLYAELVATGDRRLLVDPGALAPDGSVAIADYTPSPSGDVVAYALVRGGSRYFDWRFIDARTGAALGDSLVAGRIPVGPSTVRNPWTPDGSAFYYTRFTSRPDDATRPSGLVLLRHERGSPAASDEVVYARPDDADARFDGIVSDDGTYLIVHEWQGRDPGETVLVRDLSAPETAFRRILAHPDATFSFIGSEGRRLFFRTDLDAPRGRIIALDADDEGGSPIEVVPESDATLEDAFVLDGRFVLLYLKDVTNFVAVHDLAGHREHRVDMPAGLIWQYYMRHWRGVTSGGRHPVAYIRNLGITSAGSIYRLDLETGELAVARRSATPFAVEDYETSQHFFASADGVRIPMFVTHRKGLALDGSAPALLWVYGAFGFTARPYLNPKYAAFLETGGVLAMPNIRGGGAYGREWELTGSGAGKTKSVDDAVAAAEFLIEQGFTSPSRLVVEGNSAGGTVGGGALARRPDLFGAAILEVPVTDVLRAVALRGGGGWVETFGTPETESDFRALHSYSPYHNAVRGRCFPPVFIAAGDLDVTAVPSHAYKLTAALQYANAACAEPSPVLLRIDWGTDHGENKPQANREAEEAAELAFLADVLRASDR